MVEKFYSISSWIAAHITLLVVCTSALALFVPTSFSWIETSAITPMLGIVMFGMGLTLKPSDFKPVVMHPKDILIGELAQFVVMPGAAWALCKILNLPSELALGVILVGCCPGGTASNVICYLAKGDIALSVAMTGVSTLLAPIVTPLMVLWLAGQQIEVDAIGMFKNICIVTLLPVATGVIFNYLGSKSVEHNRQSSSDEQKSNWFEDTKAILPGVSVLCLAFIVGGVIYTVHPRLEENGLSLIALTLAVVTCHNGLGYLLGYMIGKLAGFTTAKKRTISIEVGMQNAGMATVLANGFFATPAAIAANPLAALTVVPCAISCAYHSISGTLLAGWFRSRDGKK